MTPNAHKGQAEHYLASSGRLSRPRVSEAEGQYRLIDRAVEEPGERTHEHRAWVSPALSVEEKGPSWLPRRTQRVCCNQGKCQHVAWKYPPKISSTEHNEQIWLRLRALGAHWRTRQLLCVRGLGPHGQVWAQRFSPVRALHAHGRETFQSKMCISTWMNCRSPHKPCQCMMEEQVRS